MVDKSSIPLGLPTLGIRDPYDVRSALAEEWVELRELKLPNEVNFGGFFGRKHLFL